MIIDDDVTLRKILVKIFKKIGFRNIREADNGQTAWAMILNTEVDLIITDLNMPGIDGLKLTRMIRSKPKYNNTPILVITGDDSKETIIKAVKSGVNGYIIKPFKLDQILNKIEEVFKKPDPPST